MSYQIRFTKEAKEDLKRLYAFLVNKDKLAAKHALQAIHSAMETLKQFPFTCRKATSENPFLRELVIHFGASGYVALFEIEGGDVITIIAVRHQREEDFF